MPQRALITGISGFVGGFLARHLLDQGDSVLGCSPDGSWENGCPEFLADGVAMVAWELGDPSGVPPNTQRRIAEFRPNCIYHLAALSVPGDCGAEEPTARAMEINVGGTRRVMQLARSLPEPRPRVLAVGSSHVYAPVGRRNRRVDESAPLEPRRGYGRTKLAAEQEVREAVDQGCDALVVRAFQHTGPRQSPRMMLPEWTRQFVASPVEPVRIQTAEARIDLTDVRDVVRAYRLLVERGRRGEIYNVGSGVQRRTGDVLDILRNLADPDRPIEELHPGFKQDHVADITRLVETTAWQPEIPLEQTVADTLAYWRELAETGGL